MLADEMSTMQDSNGSNADELVEETSKQALSEEEMKDQMDQFTNIMQQKFLAGEDTDYLDYSQIDNDERLDDHWLREANYDAEEKYFEQED